jgi:hypothetical protein
MGLHETIDTSNGTIIVRVSGGWLYYAYNTVAFVPLDNEFSIKEKTIKRKEFKLKNTLYLPPKLRKTTTLIAFILSMMFLVFTGYIIGL